MHIKIKNSIFVAMYILISVSGCSNSCSTNNGNKGNTPGSKGQSSAAKKPEQQRLGNISKISLGSKHTCGLSKKGDLYCWGDNEYGQLANSNVDKSDFPKKANTSRTFTEIESGYYQSCGITENGDLYCWGKNMDCQITGPCPMKNARSEKEFLKMSRINIPTKIETAVKVTKVALGGRHSCLLTQKGQVACWGTNDLGQVGTPVVTVEQNGENKRPKEKKNTHNIMGMPVEKFLEEVEIDNRNEKAKPLFVEGLENIADIVAGQVFSCALDVTGKVFCWGSNLFGALGNYEVPKYSSKPMEVKGLGKVVQISAGESHVCGIDEGGNVSCWGEGHSGKTGKIRDTNYKNPIKHIGGVKNAVEIDSGLNFSCARLHDSGVSCWGDNRSGETGRSIKDENQEPRIIPGATNAIQLGIGSKHVCVADRDGGMMCWGNNQEGQLGNGTLLNTITPTAVRMSQ